MYRCLGVKLPQWNWPFSIKLYPTSYARIIYTAIAVTFRNSERGEWDAIFKALDHQRRHHLDSNQPLFRTLEQEIRIFLLLLIGGIGERISQAGHRSRPTSCPLRSTLSTTNQVSTFSYFFRLFIFVFFFCIHSLYNQLFYRSNVGDLMEENLYKANWSVGDCIWLIGCCSF